ncbi:MAG: flagellar brake protein [Burkholderiaceae bacterium]|jgi:c-di-GMP-binding flagellar brake protein YcgR
MKPESYLPPPRGAIDDQLAATGHNDKQTAAMLQDMLHRKIPIFVFFDEMKNKALTDIAYIDFNKKLMLLEIRQSDSISMLVSGSESWLGVCMLDNIKVQFTIQKTRYINYEGKRLIEALLPTSIFRLQRRTLYRVPLEDEISPVAMDCHTPRQNIWQSEVLNLSRRGCAVLVDAKFARLYKTGDVLRVSLALSADSTLYIDVEIKTILLTTDDRPVARIGCQFIDLSLASAQALQSFVVAAERQVRMRSFGLS